MIRDAVDTVERFQGQQRDIPHPDYIEVVEDGLKSFGLPTEHLLAAAEDKPMPFLIDSFFCYGTLRKEECRYRVMKEFGIVSETACDCKCFSIRSKTPLPTQRRKRR